MGFFFITISYFLGEMRVVPIISKMINSSEGFSKNVKDFAVWIKMQI